MADILTKNSHTLTAPQIYFDVQQIPNEVNVYYYLDKVEMVSFRRRKLKKIKEPPDNFVR